jgi:hypothetical protein
LGDFLKKKNRVSETIRNNVYHGYFYGAYADLFEWTRATEVYSSSFE